MTKEALSSTHGVTELSFMPMQKADLDAVLEIETISHIHPWTRGNFSDSLEAGHWAYCILYPAVDELHLLNITVTPKLRKLGLGSRLMSAIEGVASQQKIPRIILEVRPSNLNAVNLYQKLGYEEIGVRKGYYPADQSTGAREDAIVLAKSIKL